MPVQPSISNDHPPPALLAGSRDRVLALPAMAQDTIKLGLVAAMSGQSAKSGEAIVRGLSIAIDEINAKGGLLGKKVELVVRDDESNPAKGVVAARELCSARRSRRSSAASIRRCRWRSCRSPTRTRCRSWACGRRARRSRAMARRRTTCSAFPRSTCWSTRRWSITPIKKYGAKKPGMILINNPWGELNEKGPEGSLEEKNMAYAGIEKFQDADVDVVPQLTRLKEAGADVLFMVANVAPSSQVVKSLDRMGWDVPIVSHWGPAGGRFSELAGPSGAKVHFIQTFSFSGKLSSEGGGGSGGAEEEISGDQVARGRDAGGRHRQCL